VIFRELKFYKSEFSFLVTTCAIDISEGAERECRQGGHILHRVTDVILPSSPEEDDGRN
jgi:hypothetical protein